jgi:hypothetical protein
MAVSESANRNRRESSIREDKLPQVEPSGGKTLKELALEEELLELELEDELCALGTEEELPTLIETDDEVEISDVVELGMGGGTEALRRGALLAKELELEEELIVWFSELDREGALVGSGVDDGAPLLEGVNAGSLEECVFARGSGEKVNGFGMLVVTGFETDVEVELEVDDRTELLVTAYFDVLSAEGGKRGVPTTGLEDLLNLDFLRAVDGSFVIL